MPHKNTLHDLGIIALGTLLIFGGFALLFLLFVARIPAMP